MASICDECSYYAYDEEYECCTCLVNLKNHFLSLYKKFLFFARGVFTLSPLPPSPEGEGGDSGR